LGGPQKRRSKNEEFHVQKTHDKAPEISVYLLGAFLFPFHYLTLLPLPLLLHILMRGKTPNLNLDRNRFGLKTYNKTCKKQFIDLLIKS
jgi:hypothetical protein